MTIRTSARLSRNERCGTIPKSVVHAAICSIVLLLVLPAFSAVYSVTSFADSTRATSLRGAVLAANRSESYNVILLRKGIYHLTNQGAGEDKSQTGDLDVTHGHLTIIGAG